jgi:hypothetical protein
MNDLSKYNSVKHLIKSGDCLQCRGNHLASQIIMAASGPWSHSALVIEMAGRLWVIEAVSPRVHIVSLQVFLTDYPGEVWWHPLEKCYAGSVRMVENFAIGHAEKGTPYDFRGLFQNIFDRPNADDRELFCSEFVQLGYFIGGFISKPIYADRPCDIPECNIFGEPTMLVKQDLPLPEGWPV